MNHEFVYQRTSARENVDGSTERRTDCPECGDDALVADDVHGEVVCRGCGCVVMTGQVDTGPEWTAFDRVEREQKSRVGAPVTHTMHDRGLTTEIHWHDTYVNGTRLAPRKQARMQRLRTWQERIRTNDPGERNLRLALAEIDRMASALEIPDPIREDAASLYRRALDAGLVQGRSIEGVATELGLEMRPVDPRQFVPRFCSELDLGQAVRNRAGEILSVTVEAGLDSGRSPTGLAGAAIYYAALLVGEKRTQSEIAEVARVTEVTIRNRYQEQVSLRGETPS
jgi:transcription initiation factor TFIIB